MYFNLKFAVVCSSNQNRSMEAHAFLRKKGFNIRSFGTGKKVKIPGPRPGTSNIYNFGVSYNDMYQDLLAKNKKLYTRNGLLNMLDRNRRIKPRPERFQNCYETFDIIFTVDERVYDEVVEELSSRSPRQISAVHIININVQDTQEEAIIGAFLICELATRMAESEDLDNEIDEILEDFECKIRQPILYTVQFY